MFDKLTQFGYVRTTKEAFGFYAAWLFALLLFAIVLGAIVAVFVTDPSNALYKDSGLGTRIGMIAAMILCTTFSVLIAREKEMLRDFKTIILILCTALLSLFFGGILGLIIPAYLTTRTGK